KRIRMSEIAKRLKHINELLAVYTLRPRLLAVSKTQDASVIEEAYRAGQRDFGENYLQEALGKIESLRHLADIQWHFIGPMQSNKCKGIAEHFHWVQSLDRIKLAEKLQHHCPEDKTLNICIQVNVDNEKQKAGINLEALEDFCHALQVFDRLCLRGLMTVPKAKKSLGEQHASFARLALAFKSLQMQYPSMDTLSMGMSDDF